jgi:AraC-like DNA-binding protein
MTTIGKTRRPMSPAPRGVLHRLPEREFAHHRSAPPPELAEWVEHFWSVRWDLCTPKVQETLPHPNVHVVAEAGRVEVTGVHTGRFTRRLAGRGRAFGIKFRPGAFRPWLGAPVSTLTDRVQPVEALFGAPAARALAALLDHEDDAASVAAACRLLAERLPSGPDEQALLAGRIVDAIVDDRGLHGVGELARRCEMTPRSLQRLFNDYVGVGPKWVIQRYRMHEAIAQVQQGRAVAWAALAQDLGYFDQAHFIADFRRFVGCTPADYARAHAAVK